MCHASRGCTSRAQSYDAPCSRRETVDRSPRDVTSPGPEASPYRADSSLAGSLPPEAHAGIVIGWRYRRHDRSCNRTHRQSFGPFSSTSTSVRLPSGSVPAAGGCTHATVQQARDHRRLWRAGGHWMAASSAGSQRLHPESQELTVHLSDPPDVTPSGTVRTAAARVWSSSNCTPAYTVRARNLAPGLEQERPSTLPRMLPSPNWNPHPRARPRIYLPDAHEEGGTLVFNPLANHEEGVP